MAGTKYGLKKAYIAILNTDVSSGSTYYEPEAFKKLQNVVVNPINASADVPADDGIDETIDEAYGAEGTIQRSQTTDDEKVKILGHRKLGTTVVGSGAAPYCAFGYKRTATGGTYLYVWLLKAKFSEASYTAETKQPQGITPQYDAFGYKAIRRASDNEWHVYETKTFATAAEEAAFDATWFSKAKLELLYNAAVAVNGKPSEVKEVAVLPATGTAGIVYFVTGAGHHYWDGTTFVEITPLA